MKATFNKTRNGPYQGSIYDSSATFESYGIAHGDREGVSFFPDLVVVHFLSERATSLNVPGVIAGLLAAVPDDHKEFLRNLVWIHVQVCFLT